MSNWREIAYIVIGLFIGVILHEYMHGRIADWLGDPTPRNAGRITLNPVPHIDLFGTILVPLALLLVSRGGWLFGYAKPVPINPFFLKKPRRDMLLIALAGPLTNFAIAFVLAFVGFFFRLIGLGKNIEVMYFFFYAAQINIVLGFFNLIPIPPLDGSHIVEYFLPQPMRRSYEALAPYGFIIVLGFLIFLGPTFFSWMNPVMRLLWKIISGNPVMAI